MGRGALRSAGPDWRRMNGEEFLGLRATGDLSVWDLPMTIDIAGGRGQLFGGCGLGAAISVLEQLTGRSAAWATAQFVSGAYAPEVVRVEAHLEAEGRNFVQAQVRGRVADRQVFHVQAALGARSFPDSGVWLAMPRAKPPTESVPVEFGANEGRLTSRLECRSAGETRDGQPWAPDGVTSIWVRFHEIDAASRVGIAVAADLVPFALSATFGRPLFGSSLDNTLRFVADEPSEWILIEMQVDAVRHGIGHVTSTVWSEGGALLALGTQTCVVSER